MALINQKLYRNLRHLVEGDEKSMLTSRRQTVVFLPRSGLRRSMAHRWLLVRVDSTLHRTAWHWFLFVDWEALLFLLFTNDALFLHYSAVNDVDRYRFQKPL